MLNLFRRNARIGSLGRKLVHMRDTFGKRWNRLVLSWEKVEKTYQPDPDDILSIPNLNFPAIELMASPGHSRSLTGRGCLGSIQFYTYKVRPPK